MAMLRRLALVVVVCFAEYGVPFAFAETAPDPSPSMRVDIGLSEWFSQGETVWSHNASGLDPDLGNPSSKLKYKDTGTNVTEITGRVQFKNKLFLRGAFGYGAIGGGRLTDDDFLSAQGAASQGATVSGEHRFSRTYSDIDGDDLWYLKGDLGVTVHEFQENKGSLGLFVGAQYWRERHVASGVTQAECTTAFSPNSQFRCSPPGTVGFSNQTVITNTATWASGRLGGELTYNFAPRVGIEANIALLFSYLNNEDVHHLRTDLAQDPSFRMVGYGVGTDSYLNLRVRIWDELYLTGGYRVWWNRVLTGDQWKLYGADGSTVTAPLTLFETLRHGPTVGLTYTF